METSFVGTTSTARAKATYLASLDESRGEFRLGENTTRILYQDPKLLLFTLARYKFVAKMFAGFESVLEVGCQEAWGMPIVAQSVGTIHGVDFYEPYIESCQRRICDSGYEHNMSFGVHDFLDGPVDQEFEGVFALDVLEHIEKEHEALFIRNLIGSMAPGGTAILGMPSIESQQYASKASLAGHVNCKSGPEFSSFARDHFNSVLTFCMNDEVLHTGFFPMAQYLFVICSNPRR